MATLTEASEKARAVIRYGALAFVAITLLWYLGGAAVNLYRKLYPPAPAPATVQFGKLPAIIFPDEKTRPKLALELPTGSIPSFPDKLKVFYAPNKRSGFADPDKALEMAATIGFLFKPEQKTETDYIWQSQDTLASKLEMDIISGHFTLTRQWARNPALLTMANFTSDKQVIYDAQNYLKKISLLPDDITGGEKLRYLRADSGKLVTAISLSEADFVQIDMFRSNVEEKDAKTKEVLSSYPFYRPEPDKGLIRMIVSSSKEAAQKAVYLENNYTTITYTKFSTYPLKTGQEAWDELANGGGYVTGNWSATDEIKVRRIFLAYYDAEKSQQYSMPIYVFLGDKGFVAYVSAVSNTWTGSTSSTAK